MVPIEKEMIGKVEVEAKHLLNAYSAVEKARMELYWALNQQIKAGEEPSSILPTDNVETEILNNGEVVKLIIMDYPAKYKVMKDKTRERWINNIMFALRKIKNKVSFDRIFVFVRFYLPVKDTDVDNRDIKFIVEGIKYSGLVPDDIYKYVSFGFDAVFDKVPRTEIYIIKYSKTFPEMLTQILGDL